MLQLGDCVEFALTIHLSINVIHLVFCRFKIVLNPLQELHDGFFICLRIVPLDNGFVELEFHTTDASVILFNFLMVLGQLHYLLTSQGLPTSQRGQKLGRHLL